jgi:PAS domain S-box-containing protein
MSTIKRALWAISLALVAAALIGNCLLSYRNAETLIAGRAAIGQSRLTLYAINDLLSTLKDAETGQRGYLLTGKQTYLTPYHAATEALTQKFSALKTLLADSPQQLQRLSALEPLIALKLDELRHTIDLNDTGNHDAAIALVDTDQGMQTMQAIRHGIDALRTAEIDVQVARDEHAAQLYTRSQYSLLLGMIVGLALIALTVALLRRDLRARARAANDLFIQREWFSTTLRSIGDAVIVTDTGGRVVLLNPVAEALTGWDNAAAAGKPLLEIFDIINEGTRQPAQDPVARALAEGKIVGLANHTILRSRDGREYVIEDSAAPTYNASGAIQGAVMVFHDSTQRRQAEIELSAASREIARRANAAVASERTLNTILENAPIGISMTGPGPDFPVMVMSSQMREWLGSAENMPSHAVYRKLLPDGSVPPAALLPLNRAMHDGVVVRDEPWIVERPGKPRLTMVVNVAPVRDSDGVVVGAVHSWVDMTERQRLDRELRLIESRLRVLVESDVIGLILSFDHGGNVAQANSALLNMLRLEDEDIASGKVNLAALTPVEYRTIDAYAFGELAAFGSCTPYEKEFVRKDGARISVVVGYAKVAQATDEYVGFALDVTERKQLEGQLRNQAEQLMLADRRKDEFLAMLAHELRNPLAPLRNAVHLLEIDRQQHWAAVEKVLPSMRRQIDQLVRMVDDLLDAARISQNKIVLERSPVELKPILHAAMETIQPLVQERKQHVESDFCAQPLYVDGDSARLIQTFTNLLHNATKYTDDAGHIRVTLGAEDGTAVVRVSDTGQGIDADLLPRIFDTFTQADQSLARSAGGLGVGLALVRRLSELHGGEVHASSEGPGRGSQFEVRLPRCPPPAAAQPAATTDAAQSESPRARRVLVVDDNRDLATSTAALLELWGHAAHVVYNGNEVLGAVQTFRPDVVLLDIGLPEVNGFDVAQRIRAEPDLSGVRLIAMTGYGQDRDRQRARAAGFDSHLVKPVQPEALRGVVEQS